MSTEGVHRRGLVTACALVVAMSLSPAPARGFCRTTTVRQTNPRQCQARGVPIAWAGGCVGYRVDPRLLPPGVSFEQLRSAFRTAARSWESVVCDTRTGAGPSITFVELPSLAEPVGFFRNQTNHNTFAFRDTWPADEDHDARAIAVTLVQFHPRTGVILDADMEFNLRAFEFTVDPQPVTDARHLPTVILHELGHALGLAHSPVPTAVMWSEKVGVRDALTLDDARGVCTVYPPGRVAACEHEPVVHNDLGGAGWYCASRPGARPAEGVAAWAALVAAWVARRRGRRGRREGEPERSIGGGGAARTSPCVGRRRGRDVDSDRRDQPWRVSARIQGASDASDDDSPPSRLRPTRSRSTPDASLAPRIRALTRHGWSCRSLSTPWRRLRGSSDDVSVDHQPRISPAHVRDSPATPPRALAPRLDHPRTATRIARNGT